MDFFDIIGLLEEEMKQEALARELGVSQSTISRWKSKGQKPQNALIVQRVMEVAEERGIIPKRSTLPASGDVPQFNIHAGMGGGGLMSVELNQDGSTVSPDDTDGYWAFPASVKAKWSNLGKTYAMPVTGDSMEPTLPGGSIVFVDTSHRRPSPPDLYVLDYGHGLMVKRLEMIPQTEDVRVKSDNERYETHTLPLSDLRVDGRVVGWFQWRG